MEASGQYASLLVSARRDLIKPSAQLVPYITQPPKAAFDGYAKTEPWAEMASPPHVPPPPKASGEQGASEGRPGLQGEPLYLEPRGASPNETRRHSLDLDTLI